MVQGVGIHGELFDRLTDPHFLIASAKKAAQGKRRKPDVASFLLNLEPMGFSLSEQLRAGSWRPGPYRSFWILDPKKRMISAASFADRVVHQALVSIAEPYFERRFSPCSFACRKWKGTHRALRRGHVILLTFPFVLKGDLVKFFPSIDHQVAKASLRRVLADERFLQVFDWIIDGSNAQEDIVQHFPGDSLFSPLERPHGLPIGNLTSQFLANVILDRLDHFITDDRGFGAYVRYCDDFLVGGHDSEALRRLRSAVIENLSGLRLKLHPRKGGVVPSNSPIPFLGFVLHGRTRRLQRKSIVRATKRLKLRNEQRRSGLIKTKDVTRSVRAWLAHARHANRSGIQRAVLERAFPDPPRDE